MARRFLTGLARLAPLLLAALWSGRAQALDTVRVQMAFYPQGPQAYMYLAKEKGWYRDAGLDVQLLQGRGSAYSVQVLSSGHADIGEGELIPLVFARTSGATIKIIAEWFANDGPAIIVPADSDMRGPKDLKGRKLILTAAGPWPPLLPPFLGQFGMTPADVSLVYVNSSALFPTYAAGQGDALLTVNLAFTEANPVRPSRMLNASDYGVRLPGNGIYVDEETIAGKRDMLTRFVKVSARALAYIYDGHAEEAADAIHKQEADAKLGTTVLREQIDLFADARFIPATVGKPLGWQSPEAWAERLAYLKGAHLLTGDHTAGEYFTNEIIDDAQK